MFQKCFTFKKMKNVSCRYWWHKKNIQLRNSPVQQCFIVSKRRCLWFQTRLLLKMLYCSFLRELVQNILLYYIMHPHSILKSQHTASTISTRYDIAAQYSRVHLQLNTECIAHHSSVSYNTDDGSLAASWSCKLNCFFQKHSHTNKHFVWLIQISPVYKTIHIYDDPSYLVTLLFFHYRQ